MGSADELEETVIAAAQAGDAGALEQVVLASQDLLLRIVRAHRSTSLAEEDLLQEAVLALIQRLGRYRPRGGRFSHWVSRMAVRVCLDRLRHERARTRPRAPDAGWMAYLVDRRQQPPVDAIAAADTVDYLLAALPPKDRLTLSLLDLEGHSTCEVAALTGWSTTMVKVRAFRARRRLRSLAEAVAQPGPGARKDGHDQL